MGGNFEKILKKKLWGHGERGVVAILFHAGLKEVHVCLSVCLLFVMSVSYLICLSVIGCLF